MTSAFIRSDGKVPLTCPVGGCTHYETVLRGPDVMKNFQNHMNNTHRVICITPCSVYSNRLFTVCRSARLASALSLRPKVPMSPRATNPTRRPPRRSGTSDVYKRFSDARPMDICKQLDDIVWGESEDVWNQTFGLLIMNDVRHNTLVNVVMKWVLQMVADYESRHTTEYTDKMYIRDMENKAKELTKNNFKKMISSGEIEAAATKRENRKAAATLQSAMRRKTDMMKKRQLVGEEQLKQMEETRRQIESAKADKAKKRI